MLGAQSGRTNVSKVPREHKPHLVRNPGILQFRPKLLISPQGQASIATTCRLLLLWEIRVCFWAENCFFRASRQRSSAWGCYRSGKGDRQRWTGILGSRVDRAVPEAAPLFVAEKEENWREERSMARQRVWFEMRAVTSLLCCWVIALYWIDHFCLRRQKGTP